MTPHPSPAHEAVDYEKLLVHNWRVARLTGLGIPGSLAEVYADHLDWHQVAGLVQRGCPRGWPCASPADERTRKTGATPSAATPIRISAGIDPEGFPARC
jgi:hypothetical protein